MQTKFQTKNKNKQRTNLKFEIKFFFTPTWGLPSPWILFILDKIVTSEKFLKIRLVVYRRLGTRKD